MTVEQGVLNSRKKTVACFVQREMHPRPIVSEVGSARTIRMYVSSVCLRTLSWESLFIRPYAVCTQAWPTRVTRLRFIHG